jgi:hypothetical protein
MITNNQKNLLGLSILFGFLYGLLGGILGNLFATFCIRLLFPADNYINNLGTFIIFSFITIFVIIFFFMWTFKIIKK